MQHYTYAVALRFWHPTINPTEITAHLGITPSYSSQAGQPRVTPAGGRLEGVYRESYWHAEPVRQGWRDSTDIAAEDAVLELLPRLAPHREFIRHLLATGGRGAIEVSSHGSGNYALVLAPDVLAQCSQLGLSIAHDVYAVAQANLP